MAKKKIKEKKEKKQNPVPGSKTHPGNKFAVKLSTPDLKRDAYKQYCAHMALGYPKQAFCFDHPDIDITWETMDKLIGENPSEFPPIKLSKAKAERYMFWLKEGKKLMRGEYPGGSPVVWQTMMRNMFKDVQWDQKEIEKDAEPTESAKFQVAQIKSLKTKNKEE